MLKNRHGITINLRTLQRFLRRKHFYRNGKQIHLLDIVTFIQHELEGSGSCIGYRATHQKCIRNGLMVSRVIVAQIIKHLYHIGVNTRRTETLRRRLYYSPGPNWIWHFDDYDKSKPYGFEIHGCIDEYGI